MKINEMPEGERPQYRVNRLGPQALGTAELLTLMVGGGIEVLENGEY